MYEELKVAYREDGVKGLTTSKLHRGLSWRGSKPASKSAFPFLSGRGRRWKVSTKNRGWAGRAAGGGSLFDSGACNVLGAAAVTPSPMMLVWDDYKYFDQLRYILNALDGPFFVYVVRPLPQPVSCLAVQFRRTRTQSAAALRAVYLVFSRYINCRASSPRLDMGPLG